MSDFLFGGERSGTPLETRQASSDLARMFQQQIRSGAFGGSDPSQSFINQFGFDPRSLPLGDAITAGLRDPASQTQGLFSSLEPFERRQTAEQVAGLREMFGTMGGRFSRNLGMAEGDLRSNLANQFLQTRQQGLLDANAQRNNLVASLLQSIPQAQVAANDPLRIAAQFLQPGSPIFTEGLAPGLLGAAGNLAGLYFLRGAGG